MRVVALHRDVVVAVSRTWRTTCTVLRSEEEAFVIDSPVLPDELETLPAVLEQAGFRVSALLATHADWDHLLGGLAFPGVPLGVAETTAARLRGAPGEAQRDLRAFDDEWYLERPRPLALGSADPLPVPGHLGLGEGELELHPADGHTEDGMAIFSPETGVLVCGDYLSPVEIPLLSPGGSLSAYRATLHRLSALVERAQAVVPGHGEPLDPVRAAALLREDLAYLDALERDGDAAALPLARRTPAQRRIHAENAGRLSPT